jgi:uncharacterized protein
MAGKFEIYKDKAGEFRFRLKVGAEITTKQNCKNGIESVKKNAPDAEVVDLT